MDNIPTPIRTRYVNTFKTIFDHLGFEFDSDNFLIEAVTIIYPLPVETGGIETMK